MLRSIKAGFLDDSVCLKIIRGWIGHPWFIKLFSNVKIESFPWKKGGKSKKGSHFTAFCNFAWKQNIKYFFSVANFPWNQNMCSSKMNKFFFLQKLPKILTSFYTFIMKFPFYRCGNYGKLFTLFRQNFVKVTFF